MLYLDQHRQLYHLNRRNQHRTLHPLFGQNITVKWQHSMNGKLLQIRGLMYLKAATEENDPRAAVQMAALYASGHCVEQDRVKAYQWFSSAHELDPNNTWIEKNLNQLWARMTPEERRHVQD